ncbi:hypothetical protein BDV95DRAFT_578360 [Massariosphaeria phaeospora]|uniref:Uncharacterized protein n=1 Tax=Massariosphaeria phaeospora TaxID=100035 RepID=A0A7C8M6X7_9PLEO|nr:hypothetical protein BDV95DRAFT_578360 [Massariosphaeria phaeospora]
MAKYLHHPLVIMLALSFLLLFPIYSIWFYTTSEAQLQIDVVPDDTKRISHQVASDPYQDVIAYNASWFDADGTPLFYSAWRVRRGLVPPEPSARSTLTRHGARVACWPSTGGVWIKHADVVDLDFLGLNRLRDVPRHLNNPTAEDAFCKKLTLNGAEWWKLPPDFESRNALGADKFACRTLEECFAPDITNPYLIAWPEALLSTCYISKKQAEAAGGDALGGYHNALDMEERCEIIRRLGGRECYCRKYCAELQFLDWGRRDPDDENCGEMFELRDIEDGYLPDPFPRRELINWARKFCAHPGRCLNSL